MKKKRILIALMFMFFAQTGQSITMYHPYGYVPLLYQQESEWCFFACIQMMGYIPYLSQCEIVSLYRNRPTNGINTGCCDPYNASSYYECNRPISAYDAERFLQRYTLVYSTPISVAFPYLGSYVETVDVRLPCIMGDDAIGHAYIADYIQISQYSGYTVVATDPAVGTTMYYYDYGSWVAKAFVAP